MRQAYLASGSDSDAVSEGEAAGGGGGGDEGVERYRQLLLSGGGGGAALAAQQRRGGKAWGGGDDAVSVNLYLLIIKAVLACLQQPRTGKAWEGSNGLVSCLNKEWLVCSLPKTFRNMAFRTAGIAVRHVRFI